MNNCNLYGNSEKSIPGGNRLFSPFWKTGLHSLIAADVPASQPICIRMALSKKGPLYLGSAICPSSFGTGLEGEE